VLEHNDTDGVCRRDHLERLYGQKAFHQEASAGDVYSADDCAEVHTLKWIDSQRHQAGEHLLQ